MGARWAGKALWETRSFWRNFLILQNVPNEIQRGECCGVATLRCSGLSCSFSQRCDWSKSQLVHYWISFLLMHTLGGGRWWFKPLRPRQSHEKPRRSSSLLALARSSLGYPGLLVNTPAHGRLYLSYFLSVSLSLRMLLCVSNKWMSSE